MKTWEAHLKCRSARINREGGWAATTSALILGLVAVAGSAVGAYGSMAAAQAQKKSADFNSKVASNNALAAQQQSAADAQQIRERGQRLRGSQLASMAAAGMDTGGSGADVLYDTDVQNQLDAMTTLYKGKTEAGYYKSQEQLDRFQGRAALTAGYFNAGGTLLSGVGQGVSTYATVANSPTFRKG